jgi:signal transduction histidine kinase
VHAGGYSPIVKRLPKQSGITMGVTVALGVILLVLAVLQYQWSGRISRAERERLEADLAVAMSQFRQEFDRELQRLAQACQVPPGTVANKDWQAYAERMDEWIHAASEAQLVANLYLWVPDGDESSQLLQLNRESRRFAPVPWPARLNGIHERLARLVSRPVRAAPEFRPFAWRMFSEIPMLLAPLVEVRNPRVSPAPLLRLEGFLMVEMNLDFLRTDFLPELAQRCFGGAEHSAYQVAVIQGRNPGILIYGSDPSLTPSEFSSPDARISLLGDPRSFFARRAAGGARANTLHRRGGEPPEMQTTPSPEADSLRQSRTRYWPLIVPASDGGNWALVAKHRQGSLEAAATGLRRRALAVSFGILLLLALSVGIIIAYTQRVQRLAQLQLDFVAGVSHELRTPLAVICSAGDNLADGIVASSAERVQQYGELIRRQGRLLSGMVEQILQYASDRSGLRPLDLRPVRISEVIEAALEEAGPLTEMSGFTVARNVEPDLPLVRINVEALTQALQNLINNAVKYSGDSRWLSVSASSARTKKGLEVQVAVEDRGLGIAPVDLPHVFDPFYRGGAAVKANVHGTGLGLYAVKKAVTAMGGRIRVRSAPGKGSVFTIHLAALPPGDAMQSDPAKSPDGGM